MNTVPTTRTPVKHLVRGNEFNYQGRWVTVFDVNGTGRMLTVRYTPEASNVLHSLRVDAMQHVSVRTAR